MNKSAKKTLKLINIQDIVKQFDDTYADGQTLFCKYCQHSVNHITVHSIKLHIDFTKKKLNKEKILMLNKKAKENDELSSVARHSSIKTSIATAETSLVLHWQFNKDLRHTFAVASILIEKAPLICSFLTKYCMQGDACSTTADGLSYYVDDVYKQHCEAIKKQVEDKPLALIVDETTSDTSSSLLNIVVIILNDEQQCKPVLMDLVFLEIVNSTMVGQAILTSAVSCGIKFNNVRMIVSDNAKYMLKCVREVWKTNRILLDFDRRSGFITKGGFFFGAEAKKWGWVLLRD